MYSNYTLHGKIEQDFEVGRVEETWTVRDCIHAMMLLLFLDTGK